MDLFASSVLRSLWAPALATVLAVGGCVSEKGRALDAGAPLPLHDSGASATLPEVLDDAGQADAALEPDGGDASAGQGDPDGSAGEPDASTGSDAQVDGGGPACEPGFVLDGDDCVRDLCQASDDEPAACGEHGSCSEGTDEAPTCACDEGYVLESLQCVRNPCIPLGGDPVPCDANATCTYEGGGDASCECELGYDGDGETCERNACVMLPGEDPPCAAHEDCSPTGPGTKSCACAEGFDDCDGSQGNGCEAELAVSENHCGVCGLACADGLGCDAGACEQRVSQIVTGYSVMYALTPTSTLLGAGLAAMQYPAVTNLTPTVLDVPNSSQVSAGYLHACMLRADGDGAVCWGSTGYGLQMGDTDGDGYAELALSGLLAIGTSTNHTCVVRTDGKVYCWGVGSDGQLGNGMATASRTYASTFGDSGTAVGLVTDARSVVAGSKMSCAVTNDDVVYCWGSESSTVYDPEIVRNADGDPLTTPGTPCVGDAHGCAVLADGSVVCWGDDAQGQLGSDDDPAGRNRYVVPSLGKARQVVCGLGHSCALLEDGSVKCWGFNLYGQLGSGDTNPSSTPIPVLLPPGATARAVYAGSTAISTCVELTTGDVSCFGSNLSGQLGIGSSGATPVAVPTQITTWP